MSAKQLVHNASEWASHAGDVAGLLLIGEISDEAPVRLVVVTESTERYLRGRDWMSKFGHVTGSLPEAGLVRVFFESGAEAEVSFVPPDWAGVDPVSPAAASVVTEGARVLFDPSGALALLVSHVGMRTRT